MDPVKRAALFIRMNDLLTQHNVVVPMHVAGQHLGHLEQAPEHRHLRLGLELLEPHALVPRGIGGRRAMDERELRLWIAG